MSGEADSAHIFGEGDACVSGIDGPSVAAMAKKNRRQKRKAAKNAQASGMDSGAEGDLKAKGTKSFVQGDYKRAMEYFTKAIELVSF